LLREKIRFDVHNLIEPTPRAGRFDIILCRNVLLYLSADRRRQVFDRLAEASGPDTILLLGAGETVIGQTDQFVSDSECRGLYIRQRTAEAVRAVG
jgi:chemotaxis protein methyltransferase CheR